ncbi:AMP-dependent synthetase and ligase [Denitrovibrio acetiphilus DSM 12809]|uniref:AMP-dependent synthetase and ligase n=1 Tax=Denitrovibrio acetiphilus (strain DSM 12809 / NBRC 114555 / N2460) TaxID=522772 RepID=D4H2Z3_DENA2|nr:long-chain fatty acid--CoA ligase [Denitrovibrio acetiphilus]ADD69016.1 AMP-dependent synthetase and ligase [Denitrovibrio acetiphilus DSM 12809]
MTVDNRTVFSVFLDACKKYSTNIAYIYRVGEKELEVTYQKLLEDVFILSRTFKKHGIKRGTKVLFISDNRYAWIVTDLAIASLGAILIPRGSDTPLDETRYIAEHSGSKYAIFETETALETANPVIDDLKFKEIFLVEGDGTKRLFSKVHTYNEIMGDRKYTETELDNFMKADVGGIDDIFTIIYTSGTTGYPKGVMLTNRNIMHNLDIIPDLIALKDDDIWLSILPAWHIFEHTVELVAMANGCRLVYSGVKTFSADLEHYKPTIVATVPRVWEALYSKVIATLDKQGGRKLSLFLMLCRASASYNRQLRRLKGHLPEFRKQNIFIKFIKNTGAALKLAALTPLKIIAMKKFKAVQDKFGGRLRLAVSGGGSLPAYLESWLDAIGLRIVNAYGMTECAPAIAGRALNCDVFGTLGPAVPGTEIRIVNEDGDILPAGEEGEIQIQGPQVFPGYYELPEENEHAFTDDGFFRTGDLGMLTLTGELKITGRMKDIIVLANGENIDPTRIESAITMLPFVKDAVLVGQDQKSLAALIIPDFEKMKEHFSKKMGDLAHDVDINSKQMLDSVKKDINKLLSNKQGFKPYEKLQNISFLDKDFKLGEELTNTLKKRRHYIEKKYHEIIKALFK